MSSDIRSELIEELANKSFRASSDGSGNAKIVVDDVVDAILPTVMERINSNVGKEHAPKVPKKRKRVNLKTLAKNAFVAGHEAGEDAHVALRYENLSAVLGKFEEWWTTENGKE